MRLRPGLIAAVASDFRFSQPLIARLSGVFLAAVGVFVLVLTAVVGILTMPLIVLLAGVVLAVAAVAVAGFLAARGPVVVRLDETGYRVRMIRGAGVTQARWKDVEDVVASRIAGEPCIALRLRDGRTTTLPVRVLEGDPDAFLTELQAHLNEGHGYRRIG
ncbi:MAG: hypothetical protein M3393_02020 [Actinomycetota bacterium]|nr:hypothetical protein [Actinomycetota bacterium]